MDGFRSNAEQPADQNTASGASTPTSSSTPAAAAGSGADPSTDTGANSKMAKVAFLVGMSIDAAGRKGLTLQAPSIGHTAPLEAVKVGELLPRGFEGTISIQLNDDPTTRVALSVSADANGAPQVSGATVDRDESHPQDEQAPAAAAAVPPALAPDLAGATVRIKPKDGGTWTVLQSTYFKDRQAQVGAPPAAAPDAAPNLVEQAFYAIGQIVSTRFREWFDTAEPSIVRGFVDGLSGEGQPAPLPAPRAMSQQLQLQLQVPKVPETPAPTVTPTTAQATVSVRAQPAEPVRVDPVAWASLGPGKFGPH